MLEEELLVVDKATGGLVVSRDFRKHLVVKADELVPVLRCEDNKKFFQREAVVLQTAAKLDTDVQVLAVLVCDRLIVNAKDKLVEVFQDLS